MVMTGSPDDAKKWAAHQLNERAKKLRRQSKSMRGRFHGGTDKAATLRKMGEEVAEIFDAAATMMENRANELRQLPAAAE